MTFPDEMMNADEKFFDAFLDDLANGVKRRRTADGLRELSPIS